MSLRIVKPDLKIEQQIHQTGIGLINLFGEDFFNYVDRGLSETHGKRWFLDLQKADFKYQNSNFKDPSNLLKELIRNSGSIFRIPLRNDINQKDSVGFYNRLNVVLVERNEWVHHQINATEERLKSLIMIISPIASKLRLPIEVELDFLLDIIAPETDVIADGTDEELFSDQDTNFNGSIENTLPEQIFNDPDEKSGLRIGDQIDEKFLDHSYSLLLSGSVKDRRSGILLHEVNPLAVNVGSKLLERKPTGGRLHITKSGLIAAYFEDHWGYVFEVDASHWFPGHL